jgi:hypothetical protein
MGTWNTNSLYGNDTAADMRSEMRAVLSKMPLEEGLPLLCEYFSDQLNSDDEEFIFWFALSDLLQKNGRLTDEIREKTVSYIDNELAHADEEDREYSPKFLKTFRQRITGEPLPLRNIAPPKVDGTRFKIGDVLLQRHIPNNRPDDPIYAEIFNKYYFVVIGGYVIKNYSAILKEKGLRSKYAYNMVLNYFGTLEEMQSVDINSLSFLPCGLYNFSRTVGGKLSVYMAEYFYAHYMWYEDRTIIKTDLHYTNPIDFSGIKNEYIFRGISDLNEINAITEIGEHSFVLSKEILSQYSTDYDMKLMGLL